MRNTCRLFPGGGRIPAIPPARLFSHMCGCFLASEAAARRQPRLFNDGDSSLIGGSTRYEEIGFNGNQVVAGLTQDGGVGGGASHSDRHQQGFTMSPLGLMEILEQCSQPP